PHVGKPIVQCILLVFHYLVRSPNVLHYATAQFLIGSPWCVHHQNLVRPKPGKNAPNSCPKQAPLRWLNAPQKPGSRPVLSTTTQPMPPGYCIPCKTQTGSPMRTLQLHYRNSI